MENHDAQVLARVRRAYEWGRLRHGARWLVWTTPLALLASCGCTPLMQVGLAGGVLGVLCVAMGWRGGVAGRAVGPGLLAGTVPLAAGLVLAWADHGCAAPACLSMCVPVCGGAGLAAGLAVVLWGQQASSSRRALTLEAAAVACVAGGMGCLALGAAGVTGMALGLALGAAPALWLSSPSPLA